MNVTITKWTDTCQGNGNEVIAIKTGIIGAGKVGTSIGKYLAENGYDISGFYSKSIESADIAATFTNSHSYSSLRELTANSDIILITTPDGVISTIWQELLSVGLSDSIVCHFSGLLSSEIFSDIEQMHSCGCSVHPMYAFSDKFSSYTQFHNAALTIEGHPHAVEVMSRIFGDLGHRIFTVDSSKKALYHAAASMASNHLTALMQTCIDLLSECGFSTEDAIQLIGPLAQGNLETIFKSSCLSALTGPIERCDTETVGRHLQALAEKDAEQIYYALGKKIVSMAELKHPDRNYTALKELLF